MMFERPPIVVTGAAGFIGKCLSDLLEEQGETVVRWTREMGDLRNPMAVARAMDAIKPGLIFHLAACSGSESQPDWSLPAGEVAMVQNLADALRPDGRMVHTASMSEFGYGGVLTETAPRRPRSVYGFAKACATDRALALSASGYRDIRVGCLFGVYGPGEASQRLVPHLVSHLTKGNVVSLGDRNRLRDFIHVKDVCSLLLQLADHDTPSETMVNIGTGMGVTIEQVCHKVVHWLGADPELLQFDRQPVRAIDEEVLVAEISRLSSIFKPPQQHWLNEHGAARDYVLQCAARPNP